MVRKAPSEFNESRFISTAIYNEFLLSIFLNVSMFFLQHPANPDLLYIIFFCHSQLTITILLCLIFASKFYLVMKGQGKNEDLNERLRNGPGKFVASKVRAAHASMASGNNQPAAGPSTVGLTEKEVQNELERIFQTLQMMKERKLVTSSIHKLLAIQEALVPLTSSCERTNGTRPIASGSSPPAGEPKPNGQIISCESKPLVSSSPVIVHRNGHVAVPDQDAASKTVSFHIKDAQTVEDKSNDDEEEDPSVFSSCHSSKCCFCSLGSGCCSRQGSIDEGHVDKTESPCSNHVFPVCSEDAGTCSRSVQLPSGGVYEACFDGKEFLRHNCSRRFVEEEEEEGIKSGQDVFGIRLGVLEDDPAKDRLPPEERVETAERNSSQKNAETPRRQKTRLNRIAIDLDDKTCFTEEVTV